VHHVPSPEALEQEIKRLAGAGVTVLQRGSFDTDAGAILYAQMDTEPQGKYSLGLFYFPPGIEDTINVPPNPSGLKLSQYGIVVRDLRAVSAYWHKLGFPEMTYTHDPLTDIEYRGGMGQFDQELGWHRFGKVVYEWIQPLKGPTVYDDFLKSRGEGIQHLGVNVPDMDKAISGWKAIGYAVSQAGGWGEKGKPGSGRFAYVDTDPAGGLTIELLWNYR
jgi:catechol 2,3-dioxygenase-like lactoylglutathione lyase family enzyme